MQQHCDGGFTLVELAIVLLIVALLMSGLILPLSTQLDMRRTGETQQSLSEIREALLGFAAIKGRLPCPADKTITDPNDALYGQESCAITTEGWLPWKTLGLLEIDAWGQHRSATSDSFVGFWRYRVDTALTTPIAMTTTPSQLSLVDNSGNALNTLSERPVAIVFSTGANQQPDGQNGGAIDSTYQAGERTTTFDDITIWISRPVLFSRLIAAGQLP